MGDALDIAKMPEISDGISAIFHCVHANYDPQSWLAHLPQREQAVMDVAHDLDVPVIFPESVYAFGSAAQHLEEDAPLKPITPLGEVRKELLTARGLHQARTLSIVASDLIGPTASAKGSIPTATLITPVRKGRTAWVLGSPDRHHSLTYIPDLSRAMIYSALNASELAPEGDSILLAPTNPAETLREFAHRITASEDTRLRSIPDWSIALMGVVSATTRSLRQQQYLWANDCVLAEGVLMRKHGLTPTNWQEVDLGAEPAPR